MKTLKLFLSVILLLFMNVLSAAKDPISWTVSNRFPSMVNTGQTYTMDYVLTNQLPFPLVKPLHIRKSASPALEFTYADDCSGRLLDAHESCSVRVILNPMVTGMAYVQLTIAGYSHDRVPLPEVSTQASGGSVTQDVIGTVTQALPNQIGLGENANYIFTFTNIGATSADNLMLDVTQTVGTPVYVTTCMGQINPNGDSCIVEGNYAVTSATPVNQSVEATLSFTGAGGSPVRVQTSTTVVAADANLVGSLVVPDYLPPVMEEAETKQIQFLFTASGTVDITGQNAVTCVDDQAQNCSMSLSNETNNCQMGMLTDAACNILVTFTAPAAANPARTYTITATVPYEYQGMMEPDASVSTSATVVDTLPTSRTVTLVNECDFSVWFSLNGSALNNTPNCPTESCPDGTSCDEANHKCFWNNPAPNDPHPGAAPYELDPVGGGHTSTTVTIPLHVGTDPAIQWSGNISASTLCNGTTTCGQAACDNAGGSEACAPGKGFTQPATQAEITMNIASSDSYDVEVINGFHIPVSMQPVYYESGGNTVPAQANDYSCGVPGNDQASNGFGACNWDNAVVPGHGYNWVTEGGQSCDITATNPGCPAMQLCGLDKNFSQTCGNFLGYWTGDQVCGSSDVPSAIQSYFRCNQPLPTVTAPHYPAGAVLSDLMLCSVPVGYTGPRYNTCYNTYPMPPYSDNDRAQCCGCVDWWDNSQTQGANILANSNTQRCPIVNSQRQTNVQWNTYVQNMIQWMKKTCPSAYTYPFDDKTSGFSCTNNLPGEANSTGYVITFCPGQITGLPANTNEGRG